MELGLRNKIAEAMRQQFVGNYLFSSEELEIIYNEAGRKLKCISSEWGSTLSAIDYDLIFVAIVNVTKDWHSDEEAFFNYVYRRLLGSSGSGKVYSQILKAIDTLGEKRIFLINSFKKKYYATVISHAFAPISSTESLFDMCWKIYCEDLQQQYGKYDTAFKLIAESLYNKFSNQEDKEDSDFQIGSQVYALRAGIKGLILDRKQQLVDLLDLIMESIHILFNESPLKQDAYIRILINNWWKRKEETFGIEKRKRTEEKEYIATDYSQIRPKYILDEGEAKVIVSAFRLIDHFDDNPLIQITVGEEVVCNQIISTRGSGILMSTKPIEFHLSDFASCNISISIEHANRLIYQSNNTLKRDFIFFKGSKEITASECIPGIYLLYISNIDELLQYPSDVHRIGNNVFSFEAQEGDVLQSNKKTVFFVSERTNREIYFFANQYGDAVYRFNGEDYRVIDGELYVDVLTSVEIKQYGIRYKDTSFHLTDFECVCVVDQHRRYCISNLLNVGEPQKIIIFHYSDNIILYSINIIKFNNIRLSFDKSLYYGKIQVGTVSFLTEKYDEKQSFHIDEPEVFIPIGDGDIAVKPPVLRWKIDDENWNVEPTDKGIWYKNFTNSSILRIDIPKTMSCSVCLNNGTKLATGGNDFEFKLGQHIYAARESGTTLDYFVVFIKISNGNVLPLANIYFKETFLEDPIFVDELHKAITWLPEYFLGGKDSVLYLQLSMNMKVVCRNQLYFKKTKFVFDHIPDGYYHMKIILTGNGFLKQEEILLSKSIILGNEKDLKYRNKSLCIKKVTLFDQIKPAPVRPIYIDNIKFLGVKDNFDCYTGNLFIIDKFGKKIYLNYMRNEQNSDVKINPIRIDIKSASSCYICYGLDLNDKDFEYDDEFTLSSSGKTTIGRRYLGEITKGIDFFKFEVKNNV